MPNVRFQFRRGTSAEWSTSTANPILAPGEIGIETDTRQFKIGDGFTPWVLLPYSGIQGAIGATGPQGNVGATGAVSFLSTGNYSVEVLYVNTLTVTGIGETSNISSTNSLNLQAAKQITVNAPLVLTTSTVAGLGVLSTITQAGAIIFVTDAPGGPQPVFYDGFDWRLFTDRSSIA